MEAMDARRLRLYELLKDKIGDEGATELVLQLPPRPDTLATKDDLEATKTQILDHIDARFAEVNAQFGEVNGRFGEVNGRFGQLEATLTRRMVAIMGGWTVILASTAAWASQVFG